MRECDGSFLFCEPVFRDRNGKLFRIFASVVDLVRSLVFERLVWVVRVVFGEVGGYSFEGFKGRSILVSVNFVLFQAPPKPFGEHVVDPPSFSVHTDPDFVASQYSGEFLARELRTLVGVEYFRFSKEKDGFFEAFGTELSIERGRESPRKHLSRIPVDDGNEIDEASFEPDVRDVRSPDLVLSVNRETFQEIRVFFVFPVRNARIPLRAERPDAESFHRSPDHPPSGPYAVVPGKDFPDAPLSEVRRVRIDFVDQMEDVERNRTTVGRFRIRGLPAHSEEFGLPGHSDSILPDETRFSFASIQGVRQIFF